METQAYIHTFPFSLTKYSYDILSYSFILYHLDLTGDTESVSGCLLGLLRSGNEHCSKQNNFANALFN